MTKAMKPQQKWRKDEKYHITFHCVERYICRIKMGKKYSYLLKHGRENSDERVISLIYSLRRELAKSHQWRDEIRQRLERSESRRSYLNDTEFLSYIHERYGFGRFDFLVDEDTVFVVKHAGKPVVVTCVPVGMAKVQARKNFTKKNL